jgi:hypothetical protein
MVSRRVCATSWRAPMSEKATRAARYKREGSNVPSLAFRRMRVAAVLVSIRDPSMIGRAWTLAPVRLWEMPIRGHCKS